MILKQHLQNKDKIIAISFPTISGGESPPKKSKTNGIIALNQRQIQQPLFKEKSAGYILERSPQSLIQLEDGSHYVVPLTPVYMVDTSECELYETEPSKYGTKELLEVYCFPFLLRKFDPPSTLFAYLGKNNASIQSLECQGDYYPTKSEDFNVRRFCEEGRKVQYDATRCPMQMGFPEDDYLE